MWFTDTSQAIAVSDLEGVELSYTPNLVQFSVKSKFGNQARHYTQASMTVASDQNHIRYCSLKYLPVR